VALAVGGSASELRLLWLAAVERLTSALTAGYLFAVDELTSDEREGLLDAFLARVRATTAHDIPVLLDAGWPQIERLAHEFFWRPPDDPVEIVQFGPEAVRLGEGFNEQPDGRSAVWVIASRRPAPGSRLEVSGVLLDSVIAGTAITAHVPLELVRGDRVPVVVVGPGGLTRSQPRWMIVLPGHE